MRLVRSVVLAAALCLLAALPAGAQAPSNPDLSELDRLQTLSQRNSAEAVQALQAAAPPQRRVRARCHLLRPAAARGRERL